MRDPMDALARLGADVTSTADARQAAHDRLMDAIADERAGVPSRRAHASGRPRLLPAGAVGLALAIAVVLVLLVRPGEDPRPPRKSTAAATRAALVKSERLTVAPALPTPKDPAEPLLTSRTADELARRLARTLPYPPGVRDDLRPIFSQTRPDMARITGASDGEQVAQYRAWCTWMDYWLERRGVADALGTRAARLVLADAPRWPAFRRNPRVPRTISDAARADDLGPIATQVELNCRGVP